MKIVRESLEQPKKIKFIKPELDYSELFRLFNYNNSELPDEIDKNLFDKTKYYGEVISTNMNNKLQQKFNIHNGNKIKKEITKKWHDFVDYLFELFKSGEEKTVNLDFIKNVYFGENYKKNQQSFHNFINDEEYNLKNDDLKDYYKSFEWFEKNQNKIAMPVILKLKSKYFLVGGNRRLSWLISKSYKKFKIWEININN